jgi:hypothetical protein
MVPEFGVVVPLLLSGTVLPVGEVGAVAAGGDAVEPLEPFAPDCAAHVRTSAAWQAPAKIMVEINFMLRAPCPAAGFMRLGSLFDRGSCPRLQISEIANAKNGSLTIRPHTLLAPLF